MLSMTVWVLIITTHVNSGAVLTIPSQNFATQEDCVAFANSAVRGVKEIGNGVTTLCVKTPVVKLN